jgi:hypothetical protein
MSSRLLEAWITLGDTGNLGALGLTRTQGGQIELSLGADLPRVATDWSELEKLLARPSVVTEHHWVSRSVSSWAHRGQPAGEQRRANARASARTTGLEGWAELGGSTRISAGRSWGKHWLQPRRAARVAGNTLWATALGLELGPALGSTRTGARQRHWDQHWEHLALRPALGGCWAHHWATPKH